MLLLFRYRGIRTWEEDGKAERYLEAGIESVLRLSARSCLLASTLTSLSPSTVRTGAHLWLPKFKLPSWLADSKHLLADDFFMWDANGLLGMSAVKCSDWHLIVALARSALPCHLRNVLH